MSRLRGWKVTSDGTFWGGVLALMIWGTCLVLLVMALVAGIATGSP
ncbi:hypothetical protein JNUCC64_27100 [Streptomyces sp. JNUCC 64]